MSGITVTALPAFTDNYIWLISSGGKQCAVVDPGDAAPVIKALNNAGLVLEYILITHHHWDHTGGVAELAEATGARVFGPHDPRIPNQDESFGEGDTVELPRLGLTFRVFEIPGHTSSHIAFYGHGRLFCGDTLFSVGCGRLFEGTPAQMQVSLDKLAALPPETLVFCAHEYTLANCHFALAVEPDNERLQQRTREVEATRARGDITIPSTLEQELAINPFLRSRQTSVVNAAKTRDSAATPGASTLSVIRAWKDAW